MSADASRLIERDEHLNCSATFFERAMDSSGRVVVVSGEAGIGKTSLLRQFVNEQHKTAQSIGAAAMLSSRRARWGHCRTCRVGSMQSSRDSWRSGAEPGKIFARLLAAIEGHKQLPILVIEDVHWADTSTLDLIKFLGRRITSLRALLLLSLRSDEVTRGHPIWLRSGTCPPSSIRRLELAPLSLDGVRQLAKGSSLDLEHLHRMTGGNPFFASELISSESHPTRFLHRSGMRCGRAVPTSASRQIPRSMS